jgi:hypothetical protein
LKAFCGVFAISKKHVSTVKFHYKKPSDEPANSYEPESHGDVICSDSA